MPQYAIAPTFLSDFGYLSSTVQSATLAMVQTYVSGARDHLETVPGARDPRVRLVRVGPEWSMVVAPADHGRSCIVAVRPHDDAVAFARRYEAVSAAALELLDLRDQPAGPLGAPSVSGPAALADALSLPFADWQLSLHPDHRVLADTRFAGSAQVSGGPGTGKTVIALHRAARLASLDAALFPGEPRSSVLLTAVNRLLAQTLSAQLDRLVTDPEARSRIDVLTIDGLARSVVHEHTGHAPVTLGDDALSERWRDAARADGVPYSGRFLADEWEQVILARDFTELADYVRCERSGRLLHLAPEHRVHVWEIIRRYSAALRAGGEWTYPQVALEAARLLRGPGPRYRHILVDEAQDLHPAQWRLLRAAVEPGPDDLFIVGDPGQRGYDSRVSLASLGINVRGRGHRLRVSHRVTQEILDWAAQVLGPVAPNADDGSAEPAGYRSVLHGPAPVLRGCAHRSEELTALGDQVRAWLDSGVDASTIAVAGRNQWVVRNVAKELAARGIITAALDSADQGEAVRIGTMHKLKGQEFRCVAVVGMGDPLVPPKAAIDSAEGDPVALEHVYHQERALLFMTCTRARDALYVSYVGSPSRFLPHTARPVGGYTEPMPQ
ncbi:UvrD-like helicase family protein [Murinocardiopsis flavida]|uniref:DNA 3'-5' helicase n=1 Tax=Murinocardiopsis flavida TaxID=645275 RepID=A0A2P8D522_9ACTN|nr:UvrD-like helicase family protein [Murinocardiopsis flavida]